MNKEEEIDIYNQYAFKCEDYMGNDLSLIEKLVLASNIPSVILEKAQELENIYENVSIILTKYDTYELYYYDFYLNIKSCFFYYDLYLKEFRQWK